MKIYSSAPQKGETQYEATLIAKKSKYANSEKNCHDK